MLNSKKYITIGIFILIVATSVFAVSYAKYGFLAAVGLRAEGPVAPVQAREFITPAEIAAREARRILDDACKTAQRGCDAIARELRAKKHEKVNIESDIEESGTATTTAQASDLSQINRKIEEIKVRLRLCQEAVRALQGCTQLHDPLGPITTNEFVTPPPRQQSTRRNVVTPSTRNTVNDVSNSPVAPYMKSAPTNTTKSDPVLTLNLAKSFATVSPGKLMNIKGTIPNIPNSTKIKLYLKGSSGEVFIKEAQVFYTPVAGGDAYGIKSPLGLPFTLPKNTLAGTYTLRGVITLSDGTVVEDESDSFNVKLQ